MVATPGPITHIKQDMMYPSGKNHHYYQVIMSICPTPLCHTGFNFHGQFVFHVVAFFIADRSAVHGSIYI